MLSRLKRHLRTRLARSDWMQAQISKVRRPSFEPYVMDLALQGITGRFFVGTEQAKQWYDPVKPYARLEYEWVIDNVPLKGQRIIDGGAHHGQYAAVLALAAAHDCQLVAVDPYPMNCHLTEINLLLNGAAVQIERCAIAAENGEVHFAERSNGKILSGWGMRVAACTLHRLLPTADVIKLDIEGAEYDVIPAALDKLPNVHTWIVEIHPYDKPHPDQLVELFLARGYEVLWVQRAENRIEPYRLKTEWRIHSTIFARR